MASGRLVSITAGDGGGDRSMAEAAAALGVSLAGLPITSLRTSVRTSAAPPSLRNHLEAGLPADDVALQPIVARE